MPVSNLISITCNNFLWFVLVTGLQVILLYWRREVWWAVLSSIVQFNVLEDVLCLSNN